jgi:hypothetical protein
MRERSSSQTPQGGGITFRHSSNRKLRKKRTSISSNAIALGTTDTERGGANKPDPE